MALTASTVNCRLYSVPWLLHARCNFYAYYVVDVKVARYDEGSIFFFFLPLLYLSINNYPIFCQGVLKTLFPNV